MSLSAQALAALHQGFIEAPEMSQQELLAAMTEATLLVQHEVQDNIRHGATGLTRQSITADAFSTPAGVLGIVGSPSPVPLFLELGTKPHMPPVAALVPWVRSVLGVEEARAKSVAFLIARKIARAGTKPQRNFARALEATWSQVERMFEDAAGRIAARLGGALA